MKNHSKIIRGRCLTAKELHILYGDRQVAVGKCFEGEGHFYSQREDSVLHVSAEKDLVNSLHVGFLNDKKDRNYREVTPEEFRAAVAETIYNLELDKFWAI